MLQKSTSTAYALLTARALHGARPCLLSRERFSLSKPCCGHERKRGSSLKAFVKCHPKLPSFAVPFSPGDPVWQAAGTTGLPRGVCGRLGASALLGWMVKLRLPRSWPDTSDRRLRGNFQQVAGPWHGQRRAVYRGFGPKQSALHGKSVAIILERRQYGHLLCLGTMLKRKMPDAVPCSDIVAACPLRRRNFPQNWQKQGSKPALQE